MHNERDLRELARVTRAEADRATDPEKVTSLHDLARAYEHRADALAAETSQGEDTGSA